MTEGNEQEIKTALRVIIAHNKEKTLNWAVNYAIAGLHMTGEALRVQCLYILNNIVYWRGEKAKEVRKTLKDFTKGGSKK